ncbi:ABC transporter permease [Hutsoniella sourekii]|uniref:ABC transporter permease n=1 Tax=Hutsoniella sourekii TaxID=87650 RepID=UPI00047FFF08|nr:ABC transporter permease [Hutsoniella sourekii]
MTNNNKQGPGVKVERRQSRPSSSGRVRDLPHLFQVRLNQQLQDLGKYARLIFNDHFSIILLALMALGALFYRDLLGRLQDQPLKQVQLPVTLFVVLVLVAGMSVGRHVWLTQIPDQSYLFARGDQWRSYWAKGLLLGFVPGALVLAALQALIFPLMALVSAWDQGQLMLFIGVGLVYRLNRSVSEYLGAFVPERSAGNRWLIIWLNTLAYGLGLILTVYLPSAYYLWGYLIPLVAVLLMNLYLYSKFKRDRLAFTWVIDQEQARQSKLYKWISIFADVPSKEVRVKRRSYLDSLLKVLSTRHPNPYYYIYLRSLFRNQTDSAIWLRLAIFTAFLHCFIQSSLLAGVLGCLSLLMSLVQLIPLAKRYDRHPFFRIYPNQAMGQTKAYAQAIRLVTWIQLIIMALGLVIGQRQILSTLVIFMLWIIVLELLIRFYLPWASRSKQKPVQ